MYVMRAEDLKVGDIFQRALDGGIGVVVTHKTLYPSFIGVNWICPAEDVTLSDYNAKRNGYNGWLNYNSLVIKVD